MNTFPHPEEYTLGELLIPSSVLLLVSHISASSYIPSNWIHLLLRRAYLGLLLHLEHVGGQRFCFLYNIHVLLVNVS